MIGDFRMLPSGKQERFAVESSQLDHGKIPRAAFVRINLGGGPRPMIGTESQITLWGRAGDGKKETPSS